MQCDAYLQSLLKAQKLGWKLQPTDFSSLFQLAALLYEGPWVAERYAAIKDFIERPGVQMDPVVRSIIEKAKNFNAADFFACEYIRRDLVRAIEAQFRGFDAILVPTTPTFPTLEEVHKEPVLENSLLGTYTNFVNFLDWSAISIPAGFRSDNLPFGLTIISTSWQEQKLFRLAEQFLSLESRKLGATEVEFLEVQAELAMSPSISDHALVIVGAHLSGFPLNYQLIDAGATFNRTTKTTPEYNLFALPSPSVQKPGLKRRASKDQKGFAIEVEVWNISNEGLGSLIKLIPSPLGIGSVEVEDGTWLTGFICEPWGLESEGARDISEYGGWKNFSKSLGTFKPVLEKGDSGMSESKSQPIIPLKSVLIANRGEIAVRIISTLKILGIRSVAVFSTEDAKSQHVLDADEAYHLEGNKLEETYLSGETIIQIAKAANVDAVIPGYGFLSESSRFAQACEDSGLIWIGPSPDQMKQLGLKHLARELAENSGVPLLPGTGVITDINVAISEAARVKYPVIVKSSAGGGGYVTILHLLCFPILHDLPEAVLTYCVVLAFNNAMTNRVCEIHSSLSSISVNHISTTTESSSRSLFKMLDMSKYKSLVMAKVSLSILENVIAHCRGGSRRLSKSVLQCSSHKRFARVCVWQPLTLQKLFNTVVLER